MTIEQDVHIAGLAGKLLPIVQAHPETAYPAAIARASKHLDTKKTCFSFENEVGAALRYLEQKGLLISEKVKNPHGPHGKVKRYALTSEGAFMAALAGNQYVAPAAKAA